MLHNYLHFIRSQVLADFARMGKEEWKAITETFGTNVARIRKERGITQLDLAIAVGVDQKTIVNIEKAKKTTSVAVAVLIAQTLGVMVEELLSGK